MQDFVFQARVKYLRLEGHCFQHGMYESFFSSFFSLLFSFSSARHLSCLINKFYIQLLDWHPARALKTGKISFRTRSGPWS